MALCPCNCKYHRSVDMKTPRSVNLSGFYKRSFAFHSVREVLPLIIKNIMEDLMLRRDALAEQYGEDVREELKVVVDQLAKFKYELQTNKELAPIDSNKSDAGVFNEYIVQRRSIDGRATPYNTVIMLTESYVYRRIMAILEKQEILKEFDPFQTVKQEAFEAAIPVMRELATHMAEGCECISDKDAVFDLMKIALWSNKYDLSYSKGVEPGTHLSNVRKLNLNLLCDQSEEIWDALHDNTNNDSIEYIIDNAGYEMFTDFCLIDLMMSKNLIHSVMIHCKQQPCYVSDATTADIAWMLTQLRASPDPHLRRLGQRWTDHLAHQKIQVQSHIFWSFPTDYLEMQRLAPELYTQLSKANLIIFKGDLAYRKLMGDINWNPATPLSESLRGFLPSRICMLRAIKYGVVCGLDEDIAEKCSRADWSWTESGNYGLIQYCEKVSSDQTQENISYKSENPVDLSFLYDDLQQTPIESEQETTRENASIVPGEEVPEGEENAPGDEPPAEESEPPAESEA